MPIIESPSLYFHDISYPIGTKPKIKRNLFIHDAKLGVEIKKYPFFFINLLASDNKLSGFAKCSITSIAIPKSKNSLG
jgi:hypothetical protein